MLSPKKSPKMHAFYLLFKEFEKQKGSVEITAIQVSNIPPDEFGENASVVELSGAKYFIETVDNIQFISSDIK